MTEGQTGALTHFVGFDAWGPLDYQKLDLLVPGNDKALDIVCERIMEGGDFILDEDMVAFYSAAGR